MNTFYKVSSIIFLVVAALNFIFGYDVSHDIAGWGSLILANLYTLQIK